MTTSQVSAVCLATALIMGELFQKGVDIKSYITKDQKTAVVDEVTRGVLEGEVDFSTEARTKYDTPSKVRGYVAGMVTNHFNKCLELNGGTKYEAKNPGARLGSNDDQVKNLRAVKATLEANGGSPEALAKIDEAITTRLNTLRACSKNVNLPKIDFAALPPELAEQFRISLEEAGIDWQDVAA